jgi:hypothetical protein
VKNFPTVHWEYQGVASDNKTVYMVRKMVFAGNTMIDVISMSLGLEVARRNSNDFTAVLEIEDFAPPAVTAAKCEIRPHWRFPRVWAAMHPPVQSSGSDGSARRRKGICSQRARAVRSNTPKPR